MKVFLDTNIIFSAILFPNSVPDKALQKALQPPYTAVTCDYVLYELRRNVIKKFPNKIDSLDNFLFVFKNNIEIINATYDTNDSTLIIRDNNDKPVLRAAILSDSDILITGDKDFLESNIIKPRILKAREFLDLK